MSVWLVAILLTYSFSCEAANEVVISARFNENNVKGEVTFTQKSDANNVDIRFKLVKQFSPVSFYWKIIDKPYIYGSKSCPQNDVADGVTNNKISLATSLFTLDTITLFGPSSIFGSTLMLQHLNKTTIACATILTDNDIYGFARFSDKNIAGVLNFVNSVFENGSSIVYGSLMKAPAGSSISYDVYVSESQKCDYAINTATSTQLFKIKTNVENFLRIEHFLKGKNSIMGKRILIKESSSSKVLSCSKIEVGGPLKFSSTSDVGNFTFTQISPLHSTMVNISLTTEEGASAASYQINTLSEESKCPENPTVFNPTETGAITETSDVSFERYAVGDLSGKYKIFTTSTDNVHDPSIHLFGIDSIIGRSVMITMNDNTTICSKIEVSDYVAKIESVVNFKSNSLSELTGFIVLEQYIQKSTEEGVGNVVSPTIFHVDVKYRNEPNKTTKNHNFHVHELPVESGDQTCMSVKGHYNPTQVSVEKPTYANECGTDNPYRCEVGDTSGKVGQYDIGPGKRLFVDVFAPLFGPHSILGRSITFHKENKGAPRLGCSDTNGKPRTFTARFYSQKVKGEVIIQQTAPDADLLMSFDLKLTNGSTKALAGVVEKTTKECEKDNDGLALHDFTKTYNLGKETPLSDYYGQSVRIGDDCALLLWHHTEDGYSSAVFSNENVAGEVSFLRIKEEAPTTRMLGSSLAVRQSNVTMYISKEFFHGKDCFKFKEKMLDIGKMEKTDHFSKNIGNIALKGDDSIQNRALVFVDDKQNILNCAQIRSVSPRRVSASVSKLGGNVEIIQTSPHHPADVYFNMKSMPNFVGAYGISRSWTSNACPTQFTGGQDGDMSKRYASLTGLASALFSTTDENIQLFGAQSVTGHQIAFLDTDGKAIDCNTLSLPDHPGRVNLGASVVFDDALQGVITMSQVVYPGNEVLPTIMYVNVTNKNGNMTENHNWHVHELPLGKDEGVCSSVKGHYNPSGITKNTPGKYTLCSADNIYRCEVGDTSAKVGIYDIGSGTHVFVDEYTPLYGEYSVVGRSITFHEGDKGAPRLGCGDISPKQTQLIAHLHASNLRGTVTFQKMDDMSVLVYFDLAKHILVEKRFRLYLVRRPTIYGENCPKYSDDDVIDLSITADQDPSSSDFIDFYRASGLIETSGESTIYGSTLLLVSETTNKTLACSTILAGEGDHHSFVHFANEKVTTALGFIYNERQSETLITGHVNAADVSQKLDWYIAAEETEDSNLCHELTTRRVNLGGDLGLLNSGVWVSKILASGVNSTVNGHWLVVLADGKILGCGRIENKVLKAEAKSKEDAEVEAVIEFSQLSPFHATDVRVKFSGLGERMGGYHIHQFPMVKGSCAADSVGGHFDPPIPHSIDEDKLVAYEVGDLSAKYGMLNNLTSYDRRASDITVQLYGVRSIIGRSIVVHYANGSRHSCYDIVQKLPQTQMFQARLDFTSNSRFSGYIQMTQVLGGVTSLVVDVKHRDDKSRVTKKHNWHVHELAVGKDTFGVCSSVLGHYNPNKVSVTKPAYANECATDNPYRCEVGDTSGKVGQYDIGAGKKLFVDVQLPLYGKDTVVGRSIAFYQAEGEAPRLACASIKATGERVVGFAITLNASHVDMTTLKRDIMELFNVTDHTWLLASYKLSFFAYKCHLLEFQLIDNSPNMTMKAKYEKIFNEAKISTGIFHPSKHCQSCETHKHCGEHGACIGRAKKMCTCVSHHERKVNKYGGYSCVESDRFHEDVLVIVLPILIILILLMIVFASIFGYRRIKRFPQHGNEHVQDENL